MASNVRFLDQVPVSAYGNTTALTIDTGSFMITGSASGSTLTFTKGDGTTFELFVSGSGSGGGTSVIANPGGSGDALTTISIDGTVYVISGSGGSGAGFPYTGSAGISGSLDVNGIAASIVGGELNVQNYTPITVGVITKTINHRYYDTGSSNGYTIDGLESPYLNMYPGKTYRFITSSASHPIKFYRDASKATEYTTNVTYGADYAQIFVTEETPGIIYYQCGSHDLMGNALYLQGVTQVVTAQTASFVETAQTGSFVVFNGDRPVSNQDQPLGIRNVNFSASGLADFINKVYFTNTAPNIITDGFTIGEFVPSGSLVGVITASDAESGSQTLSYQTASSYVADQFRISSSGDFGYLKLNVKSTESMNTFNDSGTLKAPLPIVVTDSFGESTEKTLYIRIIPNTPPIWSDTAGSGNNSEITSSLSESSAIGNNKDQYYYRDAESDTITIGSGSYLPTSASFAEFFNLDVVTGVNPYVRLNQTAAPLDYDTYPSYSFVLTASDQHYQDGDDPDSITYLPVQISIRDNEGPEIDPQTLTGVNESSSAGTSAGVVSASDPEGLSLFVTQFQLLRAYKNGVNTNITSSLSASSQNLFTASLDPFQIATSQPFTVTRKASQFLNFDIADRYVYRVTVRDDYNPISQSAEITIPIADHIPNTITTSSVFNIIESAITNERVKQSAAGIGGSDSTAEAANSSIQRWTVVSSPDFIEPVNATGSITQFQLKSNLSGSATVGGDTITIQVTASQDNFETTVQTFEKIIDVELLVAPNLVTASINSGNNLNTNGARPEGQNLFRINIDDGQPVGSKYDIDHSTWVFTPNAGQNLVAYRDTTITPASSGSYYVSASANLAAGNYGFTASVENTKGFRAGTLQRDFEILQAGNGTLGGDNPSYIIESSTGTAQIKANLDGYTGAQADLDVSYGLTGYNGAAVQSYTSSNALIAVTNTGLLSVTGDISGSYTSGDTITSTITFRDQYDNIGTGTATVNVTNDVAPTVVYNITNNLLTASIANSGVTIGTVTANDAQGFNVTDVTLGGANASDFNLVETTTPPASNRVFNLQPSTNLTASTYNITVTAKDSYGQETTEAQALNVVVYPNIPEMFVYISSRGNNSDFTATTTFANPPQLDGNFFLDEALGTAGQVDRPFGLWKAGRLGESGNITTTGTNNMRMVVSKSAGLSGNSLNGLLSADSFNAVANGKAGNAVFILYPSSSDARLTGVPSSVTDAFDPASPVVGQYVMSYYVDDIDKGEIGSKISSSIPSYVLDLDGAGFTSSNGTIVNDGDAGYYRYWSVLTPTANPFSQTAIKLYLTPQSGSSPV